MLAKTVSLVNGDSTGNKIEDTYNLSNGHRFEVGVEGAMIYLGSMKELTILAVQEGGEHNQQAGERRGAEHLAVPVQRAQRQGALAQVAQALRQAHHEQVHGGLGVEEGQRAQHGGEAGVVGTGTHQAHCEDCVVGHVDVGIVRILVEDVYDWQLRVGDGAEGDGEGDGSADGGFSVATL